MIGIVGAGVTGLSLGVLLQEDGIPFHLLEASNRAGGVIRSTEEAGRVLDHGPQRTRVTPPVARMVRTLGLESSVVEVPRELPLFILRGGRLRRVPFTARDLIRTDLLSRRGKLRLLAEPFTRGLGPEETVGDFLVRKFGEEAYENLMGPLFGGLYGSDPRRMYVRHSLAQTMEAVGVTRSILWAFLKGSFNRQSTPPAISFQHGMEDFTAAMFHRIRGRIRLKSPVVAMDRAEAGGWILRTPGADPFEVSRVVLTLDAHGAADLLEPSAPEAARRLRALRYNDLLVVHLAGDCELRGLGYQVSYGEGLRTRGVTWNASALGRRGVYTAFLGGARDPAALELPDEEVGRIAAGEFHQVTGCRVSVLGVSRTRVPSWDRSWEAMEGLELPPGVHLCTNYESRVGIPGRLARAGEMVKELTGD